VKKTSGDHRHGDSSLSGKKRLSRGGEIIAEEDVDADTTMVETWTAASGRAGRISDATVLFGEENEEGEEEEEEAEQKIRVVGRRRRSAAELAHQAEKRRKLALRIYYTKSK
jgi:hypothetical protein